MCYNERIKNKLELLFSLQYSLSLTYSDFSYTVQVCNIFLSFYLQTTGAENSLHRGCSIVGIP